VYIELFNMLHTNILKTLQTKVKLIAIYYIQYFSIMIVYFYCFGTRYVLWFYAKISKVIMVK